MRATDLADDGQSHLFAVPEVASPYLLDLRWMNGEGRLAGT
ncbi:hypothetical protein [Streptomyces scopuliridis]|nr:hypothetical protein [Streptomyces scopuliridis]